ncbi:MAG: ROK family protein [Candidatus Omnitrophica bacterium]|nr:ROK family protein [Candidatus Omnitrophota bacterium]
MPAKFIVAVDLGGTNLKLALIDSKYRIIDRRSLSTKKFRKKEDLISAIVNSVNNIIAGNSLVRKNILGVGLGLPGPVDIKRGIVHFLPNIPGWKEVNLQKILKKRLKLPVFIDNDANLMCLAEQRLGAAKGLRNVVCLTLGTGVGGGIIIEDRLYRGSNFAAGEIGHMPINEKGPLCNCGGVACLEAYIGNVPILKEAKKMFGSGMSLEGVSLLAKRGNKEAKKFWLIIAKRLAANIIGVVNLLNPDAIVIGGGVAEAGLVLFDRIKDIVKKQAMPVQARAVKILRAKMGNNAGLIGAALLVKGNLK